MCASIEIVCDPKWVEKFHHLGQVEIWHHDYEDAQRCLGIPWHMVWLESSTSAPIGRRHCGIIAARRSAETARQRYGAISHRRAKSGGAAGLRRESLTFHVSACTLAAMKLTSLPCYCATLRQAARAVTVLYEDMLADSGLYATQYTALQLLDSVPNVTTTELAEALGIDQTTA